MYLCAQISRFLPWTHGYWLFNRDNMDAKSKLGNLEIEKSSDRALTRVNFIMMAVCGLIIVLGFCLMAGGATTTDNFNPDIFSTRRIIIGPALSFIGFVLMAFAIMYRPKNKQ